MDANSVFIYYTKILFFFFLLESFIHDWCPANNTTILFNLFLYSLHLFPSKLGIVVVVVVVIINAIGLL